MKTTALILMLCSSLCGQGFTVATVAGGGLPVDVPPTSFGIGYVSSVAVDPAGNLFFVSGNAVIRLDAATRTPTLVAGTGIAGFSGDNGPAVSARLDKPVAVAVDSAGNIYIADSARIRKVSNGIITTIAGNGIAGATGDNGPAVSAQVAPLGLAVDPAGSLYLTNTVSTIEVSIGPAGSIGFISGSIRKISNGIMATIAGNGTCCGPSTDNVSATSVPLYEPGALAVDASGNLYVASSAEEWNGPGVIRKISGGAIATVASMNEPGGLAVDSAGNLYIADTDGNRILELSQGAITTVAGIGTFGFSGDNGPAIGAQFT